MRRLQCRNQRGHENAGAGEGIEFKMKPSTKFGKMMQAYCSNKRLDIQQLRFHYDRSRIQETDTPTTIGLLATEDEFHVIEVVKAQTGKCQKCWSAFNA